MWQVTNPTQNYRSPAVHTTQQCAEEREDAIGIENKHIGAKHIACIALQEGNNYRGIKLLSNENQ